MTRLLIAATLAAFAAPLAVQAAEVRVGAGPSGHDLVVQVDDVGQEQGSSVSLEATVKAPALVRPIRASRAYVGTAISLDGHTNFVHGGLLWRAEGERFYGEAGAGLALHDGEIDLPQPQPGLPAAENAARARRIQEEIAFGSRVLLHFTLAVGYRINDRWAVELGSQHWSHGGLFGDNNDGADQLFLRTAYRFGE